jgi:Ca2+-binding RTX toxin-like protein
MRETTMATRYRTPGNVNINGTNQADYLYGWAMGGSEADPGVDHLWGLNGNDYLAGGGGDDFLYGGQDNDTLNGGAGADWLQGDHGNDTAFYGNAAAGVSLNLLDGNGYEGEAAGDRYLSIENVIGSAHNDNIVGDHGWNVLKGGGGHDTLVGLNGNDDLYGGDGTDHLYGGRNDDELYGGSQTDYLWGDSGEDLLNGGDGDDFLWGGADNDRFIGDSGRDTMDGGLGRNWVDYSGSTARVVVNLQDGTGSGGYAEGDRLSGIQDVIGSRFGDTLTGNGMRNYLNGGDGIDTLRGGAGEDSLHGGPGADILIGGSENDQASYGGGSTGVHIELATGVGRLGEAEGDTYDSIEDVSGTWYADTLIGDSRNNTLQGNLGPDYIRGGDGLDRIYGGDYWWVSDDPAIANRLWGDGGADFLYGGDRADRFMYEEVSDSTPMAFDEIANFSREEGDRIDLSGIDAIEGTAEDDVFEFIDHDFTAAGQLRVEWFGGSNWNVYGNTDSDLEADFMIRVHTNLTASDFGL